MKIRRKETPWLSRTFLKRGSNCNINIAPKPLKKKVTRNRCQNPERFLRLRIKNHNTTGASAEKKANKRGTSEKFSISLYCNKKNPYTQRRKFFPYL